MNCYEKSNHLLNDIFAIILLLQLLQKKTAKVQALAHETVPHDANAFLFFITPERVTRGRYTVSHLTGLKIEPMTSRADSDVFNHYDNRLPMTNV